MSSMGGGPESGVPLDWSASEKRVRGAGYVNKVLQQICENEGVAKKGLKAELQQRIVDRLKFHAASGDTIRFTHLKNMIDNPGSIGGRPSMTHSTSPGIMMAPAPVYGNGVGGANGYRGYQPPILDFKSSPYYTLESQLGATKECPLMQAHRHTIDISLKIVTFPELSRAIHDKSMRVMLFCSPEPSGRQDVAFPHQSEIKVNGGEVKANLRGLKNKPGSTRPVDVTSHLRLQQHLPHYENKISMTYALTTKKFYLLVYLVKVVEVEELAKRLETGKRIPMETVIADMINKSKDADIVATASVLSLKCPLSTLRMSLPCRGIACRHNQCFDGTSYLQLQEQGPTWLCPICNRPAPFDQLVIDEYLGSILTSTSRSVDQVTVQPDGRWDVRKEPVGRQGYKGVASTSDDDDDLIEITKTGDHVSTSAPRATPVTGRPCSTPFREASSSSAVAAPQTNGSMNGKRPIAAVIDLTSDDEDDPVQPPAKRLYYQQPTLPSFRPGLTHTPTTPAGSYSVPPSAVTPQNPTPARPRP
ncbi:PINIT domain-containing protein [Calycina marina]|uniref:PINIT domain-containing protein n=1 Tax=Calycina marina TaxID=1763456 RepID=A0A9P7YZ05_9HELO|nr:PINIT domain-containing protein [Calycina marina]